MELVGVQIRHFKSALQCLGKIGEEKFEIQLPPLPFRASDLDSRTSLQF